MLNFQINFFGIKQIPLFIKNLNHSLNNSENNNIRKLIIPDINKEIESKNNKLDEIQEVETFDKIVLTDIDYEFLESIAKKKKKKRFINKLNKSHSINKSKELKEKKNLINPQVAQLEQKTLIIPTKNQPKIINPEIKNEDCNIF